MTLPAKDDLSTLGGAKVDYQPSEDPTTDQAAADENVLKTDVAMSTRTIDRAYVAFAVPASLPGAAAVLEHDALWGNDVSVLPTVTGSASGSLYTFVITWPATVLDELSVSQALNLRRALPACETNGYVVSAKITAPNVATVQISSSPPSGTVLVAVVW